MQPAGAKGLQVSPLRQTMRPFGFGRDDKCLLYTLGEILQGLGDRGKKNGTLGLRGGAIRVPWWRLGWLYGFCEEQAG